MLNTADIYLVVVVFVLFFGVRSASGTPLGQGFRWACLDLPAAHSFKNSNHTQHSTRGRGSNSRKFTSTLSD